jgi:transposase
MNTLSTLQTDGREASVSDTPAPQSKPKGVPRMQMPNRNQIIQRPVEIESLLPAGHRARVVWSYVERQDMSSLYAGIKAFEGGVGRTPIAPKILFALWLFATLESVSSAREIEKLTLEHDAYRWICGGVSVNYHTVADFRSDNAEYFEEMLTNNVACLMMAGVCKLKGVAQDGVRVRASAGAASFRREEKLKSFLVSARERVEKLKRENSDDSAARSRRKTAAALRAAKSCEVRVEAALACIPELAEIKRRQGKKPEEARASTTDPEATVMKMADGGYRPAYNVEFASDTESLVIVGVDVVTTGSDMAQMAPMVEQIVERCGKAPEDYLVDGGFTAHDQIDAVAPLTRVLAPVPKPKSRTQSKDNKTTSEPKTEVNQYERKSTDSAAVGDWRERMATDEAKERYKDRASTAECTNAQSRNRGLVLLPVRGLDKVKSVALLFALAHNLMCMIRLTPELLC